ncbi:hypothetical protein GCM10020358_56100 [Amorphoplanes nipponensis]|uniref:Uncharacterized protein n=1 Tax=Actinoplanes nipponensis TaxID=135950 RepID=A0A919JJV9_9ACTN|nr:DUF6226 family protein [Actinoplanes nipponensis]GIE51896.1 hypothetical protein Ani05nite_54300 [Actinoplanes nipponensis]
MGDFGSRPDSFSPRVSDSRRFLVLHEAAEDVLDELTARYVVDRREGKEPVGPAPDAEIVRTVRLVPRTPAAGPLAIAFTDFPGLVLRLGRWYLEVLPDCGCDECAEDPAELVADLRARVLAHVEGGLWERVRRGVTGSWLETRLIGPGLRVSRQAPVDPAEARAARREGFAAPVQWAPWPRRAPQT